MINYDWAINNYWVKKYCRANQTLNNIIMKKNQNDYLRKKNGNQNKF